MRRALLLAALFAALVAALVAIAFARGLSSDGDAEQLRALKSGPMARYAPAGARLISRHETEAGEDLGRPRPARLYRAFELPPGAARAALADAADAAPAAGWAADGSALRTYLGTRRLHTGVARLTIALQEKPHRPAARHAHADARHHTSTLLAGSVRTIEWSPVL